MKNIFKKNQVAITSLAIMIAVAGYLNFTGTQSSVSTSEKSEDSVETIDTMDISDGDALVKEKADASAESASSEEAAESSSNLETSGDGESAESDVTADSTETIGDAVLTQAQVNEYVAGAKLEREQAHSKTKDSLNEIIDSESVGEDAKKEAVSKLTELAEIMEKESATEQLLGSKGFADAVVSIGDNSVDVVLNFDELSQSERAQIEDIVTRKTGRDISQLVISKMQMSES